MNIVKTLPELAKLLAPATMLICAATAQTPLPTILNIDMENVVQYQEAFLNPQKNGTSTAMESGIVAPTEFFPATFIADIVAINGKKCKGATVARNYWVGLNTNPANSQAIADVTRFHAMEISFEILQADGTPLGTIVLTGLTAGGPPVGSPKAAITGTFAVIGGTGAFLGARGQAATTMQTGRNTSTLENPINRRTFPGGLWKMVVQLIPLTTPEVVSNSAGPVILHSSDYSPVTIANPAVAGETLVLLASGLGPTKPGVDPGQVFPVAPVSPTIAPIEVLVNGKTGDVLYAGGYPNTLDNYQVNVRIPPDTAPGIASLQLRAAWVNGGEVKIPVR